jgi:hypothetical protein
MVRPKDAQVNVKVTPEIKEEYYKVASEYGHETPCGMWQPTSLRWEKATPQEIRA